MAAKMTPSLSDVRHGQRFLPLGVPGVCREACQQACVR
jgi:hypothetical protein